MAQDKQTSIPAPNSPFLDSNNRVNQVWWQFLLKLFVRTGGAPGIPPVPGDIFVQVQGDVPQTPQFAELNDRIASLEALVNSLSSIVMQLTENNDRSIIINENDNISLEPIFYPEASQDQAGLMSAADKIKLDSL